jgi:uncharacterized protein involved in exopolysaccharide biosynthesis
MKPFRPDVPPPSQLAGAAQAGVSGAAPRWADVEGRLVRTPRRPSIDDPVSLKLQLHSLWQDRLLIGAITLGCTLLATLTSLLLPTRYTATSVLSPVTQRADSTRGLGTLGTIATEVGGSLAALAGFATAGDAARNEALEVLQSEALTEKYIADGQLLPVLYPDKWDPQRHAWRVSGRQVPTLWRANRYFDRSIRKVTISPKTGLVTLTITWSDPQQAARWANDLVRLTNDYLRGKALAETERHIAYLNGEAAKTQMVETRQAVFVVLRNELDRAMLARGSEEYALKVLDPAVPPEEASSPVKKLWAAAGLALGLFLGISFSFLRSAWRESP